MAIKRHLVYASTLAITVAGVAIALNRPSASAAHPVEPALVQAKATAAAKEVVRSAEPRVPLANSAASDLTPLFTPADPLPAFFSAPLADGGQCVVTSVGVLASCLPLASPVPGTITIADDSEVDDRPPFVYGVVRPSVKAVQIVIRGQRIAAPLMNGFYVLQLGSATDTTEAVDGVAFAIGNGKKEVLRLIDG
jgi:hypothetical protein